MNLNKFMFSVYLILKRLIHILKKKKLTEKQNIINFLLFYEFSYIKISFYIQMNDSKYFF